jgi:hypothetical protein
MGRGTYVEEVDHGNDKCIDHTEHDVCLVMLVDFLRCQGLGCGLTL